MKSRDTARLLQRIDHLNAIGVSLSAEKDTDRLLEMILVGAKELTNADGGTLYLVTEDHKLRFEIIRTDSLGYYMGGTSGKPIAFPPIPLYHGQGEPNLAMVATCAALKGESIRVDDAYTSERFDFGGTRTFDARTGYRSRSFLTIPMKNHEDRVVGVLQLINALKPGTAEVIPFSEEDQQLVASLASQASVALTQKTLIEDLERLFTSFIHLIAGAIDDKSPYTAGHCLRVPVITLMLADAVDRCMEGPLRGVRLTESDRQALEVAAWLHDCGKITTPEHIVDKSRKLETIFDRMELVASRFEILKRDAEIAFLRHSARSGTTEEDRQGFRDRLESLEEDCEFLRRCNVGNEYLSQEDRDRIAVIAGRHRLCNEAGELVPVLSAEEVDQLSIARGTLSSAERELVNNHIVSTIKMLRALPFPEHLRKVPEYAGGHHEKMDGSGYPQGLRGEQMPVPARILAIADVFEALTAKDRPYKKAKCLSEALRIMGFMKEEGHIDPDLFDVFIREKIYLEYAREYLHPDQIDVVDHDRIPGYAAG